MFQVILPLLSILYSFYCIFCRRMNVFDYFSTMAPYLLLDANFDMNTSIGIFSLYYSIWDHVVFIIEIMITKCLLLTSSNMLILEL